MRDRGDGAASPGEVAHLAADWPAPAHVHAFTTLRGGGASRAPFESFNLAAHVGDDPAAVAANRGRLRRVLPAEPFWLEQRHETRVEIARQAPARPLPADAAVAFEPHRVAVVLTADCLPIVLCDREGTRVAAVHAGWRGLCQGVVEAALAALECDPAALLAWIGPGIGPSVYEVGEEVRAAFLESGPGAQAHFQPSPRGRWLADLPGLAGGRLRAAGVESVSGGTSCTASEPQRFFSYRRDGRTGRMATVVWFEPPSGPYHEYAGSERVKKRSVARRAGEK